jgi:eukaryotic-like serine/threonine-protein kinase
LAFSHSGAMLAIASEDICLWDIATTRCTRIFGTASAYSLAFSPDGKILAVGDSNGETYLWNVATKSNFDTLRIPGDKSVMSVAFSLDDQILIAGDANGKSYVWNTSTRKLIAMLPDPDGKEVLSVACSRDYPTVATGD